MGQRHAVEVRFGQAFGKRRDQEVQVAVPQGPHQAVVEAADHPHAHAGPFRNQPRDRDRQEPAEPGRPGTDSDLADLAAGHRADLGDGVAELHADELGVPQQRHPALGQFDPARPPDEQFHPQLALQIPDALGYPGLRQAECPGGAAETAVLGHGDEVPKLYEIHLT